MEVETNSVLKNGEDNLDAFGIFDSKSKNKHNVPAVLHKDSLFYKMDHPQTGIAVIFNHETFLMSHLKDRSGTQADCDNLKKCLDILGFEVKVYHDLYTKDVLKTIEKLSELDYSQMDCLVICILSHGESGVLYAKDSGYKPDDLWEPFSSDKCKTLAGKPKLFFIQACRGTKLDPGVTFLSEVDSSPSYKMPIHADFLMAYSTIPVLKLKKSAAIGRSAIARFFSWRNTGKGSWFIQALSAELKENGFKYDILTLLTFVNRRVAVDFESYVPGDSVMHAQKQIPCITSMLTRLLKFQEKKK